MVPHTSVGAYISGLNIVVPGCVVLAVLA